MNEGLANGADDFNVFSALNGNVNFQDLSSEIDGDATELNLVEAVTSGEKIDTSFAEENEVEATEECLDAERRLEICQNIVSAACASCAVAGNCPILRMRNFAEDNLQKTTEERKSYLSDLMNDNCDFVVAGYVSADNEEKASESIEKDSPSENEKTESVPEKPAVKSEASDDDASIRMSEENNEVNKSTDDECLNSESASSENIPSAKIIKENIQPKINEEPEETEVASQINLMDSEDVDEKIDIHKEDVSFENQAPTVDKEDELSIKKDSHVGDENDINSAPIFEDSTLKKGLAEKVISNESNFSPVRDFVQVNNEIDVVDNNSPAEIKLSGEAVCKRTESVELIENKKDLPILSQRDFEEREVCFEDSENIAMDEDFDNCIVVNETDNIADDLGDCVELTEECSELVTTYNSSDEKASYNCDEDDTNNTNISGVYSGIWADDSPLNPEDDKTSNVSYNSSVLSGLIALVGSLAVRIVFKKQEGLCK